MSLSTELFVMTIFIAGSPFFYFVLRDSDLRGRNYFMYAFLSLVFSNIFTVIEEFGMYTFFDTCEHVFITIASIMMFIAVFKMTSTNQQKAIHQVTDKVKD